MGNVAGSLGGHFTTYGNVYEIGTNVGGNYSTVRIDVYLSCDSTSTGMYNLTGASTWGASVNGNNAGGNFNYDFRGNNNTIYFYTYDTTVYHDANGYGSCGWSTSVNMSNSPYATTGSNSGSIGLTRLALAPGIAGTTADTIKPTQARLGGEITGFGHGTSANMNMYVRLQGSGSWTDLGNQNDAAGYNYWTATGLKPGKTYEYMMSVWNNNGDGASSSIQTFKTTPVSGMVSVIKAMV